MFGKYDCSCGHNWASGNTWIGKWQKCQICESEVMPSDVRPLKPSRAVREDQKPHDTERCQKCLELGYNCRDHPSEPETDYLDDDSTDSGSVFSEASTNSSSSFTDWNDEDRTPVCSDEEETDRLLDRGMKRLQLK